MSVSNSKLPGSDLDTSDSAGIRGGTDATIIGNTGDRLKVTAVSTENEVATFNALTLSAATATNKSMISLVNASGSPVKIKIRHIQLVNTRNTAVTGVVADINLYRCTGHSAGTVVISETMDSADTLNANVTVRTGATITGEGTNPLLHLDLSTDEWGAGAADVESFDHTLQSLFPFYIHKLPAKPLTLNAGEGITLKCITATTTGLFDILIIYTQE